jgi:hypothetical protein
MADTSRIVRPIVFVICIGATALGLNNVFGDNREVVSQAEKVACGDKQGCIARMTRGSRSPIGQSFSFQTDVKKQEVVDVDCRRSAYLLGEWSCGLESK